METEEDHVDLENTHIIVNPDGDVVIINLDPKGLTEEQGEMVAKILCVIHEPSFVLLTVLNMEMFFRYIAERFSAWIQRIRNDRDD